MAAAVQTLQTRWDMKEEIRVPIEKGAFISAPSCFCSIRCQGNTLLTSYLPNNDHNLGSALPRSPPRAGSLCVACNKKKKVPHWQKGAAYRALAPWLCGSSERERESHGEMFLQNANLNQDNTIRTAFNTWRTKGSCAGFTMLANFFSHLQLKTVCWMLSCERTLRKQSDMWDGKQVGWARLYFSALFLTHVRLWSWLGMWGMTVFEVKA